MIKLPGHIRRWPKKAQRRYLIAVTPKPWNPMMLAKIGDSFLYVDLEGPTWMRLQP